MQPGPPLVHGGHLAVPGVSRQCKTGEGKFGGWWPEAAQERKMLKDVSPGVCVCPAESSAP